MKSRGKWLALSLALVGMGLAFYFLPKGKVFELLDFGAPDKSKALEAGLDTGVDEDTEPHGTEGSSRKQARSTRLMPNKAKGSDGSNSQSAAHGKGAITRAPETGAAPREVPFTEAFYSGRVSRDVCLNEANYSCTHKVFQTGASEEEFLAHECVDVEGAEKSVCLDVATYVQSVTSEQNAREEFRCFNRAIQVQEKYPFQARGKNLQQALVTVVQQCLGNG